MANFLRKIKKNYKKLKRNSRFYNIGSVKRKILLRRKKVWKSILTVYVAAYITMNNCQALPMPNSHLTLLDNVINPEQTIEIVNCSRFFNTRESKGSKISNPNKKSKNSNQVMTLDRLKKSIERDTKIEYVTKYAEQVFQHGDQLKLLLSFERDLEELASLKESFIKTKSRNGVKTWDQLVAENRYKDKLQEIQSKFDELAQKDSNNNNAIFRTNKNGVLKNGHLISGNRYLTSGALEEYEITIIKK